MELWDGSPLSTKIVEEWWNNSWGHPALVDENDYFVKVSPGFAEIMGMNPYQLVGKRWQDVTHPADIKDDKANVELTKSHKQEGYIQNKRYKHVLGHYVDILLKVRIIHDEYGDFLMFLSQINRAEIPQVGTKSKIKSKDKKPKFFQDKLASFAKNNWKVVGGLLLASVAYFYKVEGALDSIDKLVPLVEELNTRVTVLETKVDH